MDLVVTSELPVDLTETMWLLRYGGLGDPCLRMGPGEVWRASRFASGPATVRLQSLDTNRVGVTAWGPGAEEALAAAPALIGADDDDGGLAETPNPFVRDLARRVRGLRIGRTNNPMEALVPTILHQKVQGKAARASFCRMVRAAGMPAPRPIAGDIAKIDAPKMLLPPTAEWLVHQPSWAWHRWGVEEKRAVTIRTAASYAHRIAEATNFAPAEAAQRLRALPGVGEWTAAEVAAVAFGDPDAVAVGDYWLCHIVCHALAGEVRGDDERMLELLAPWSGQRGRLCRLISAGGPKLPRFGPRLSISPIADW